MAVVVELNNVSFSAQNTAIVKNFSHRFEEGNTTALVGPSGSGKSTVLKLAAGLLVPSQGEVNFRGRNISAMSRKENLEFRREASMVFQDSALLANQNLFQILELPLRIHFPEMPRAERESRIREVSHEVGYKRDLSIRPSSLSMGEQKLIAFARAMILRPRILFLDEWTESLDEKSAQRLIMLVKSHQQEENHTVLFVSHDIRTIRNLSDYILFIMEGETSRLFTREQIANDDDLAEYLEKGIAS